MAFTHEIGGDSDEHSEIAAVNVDGTGYARLTTNSHLDAYPVWSPDDTRLAYLSFLSTLDMWVMAADGSDAGELFDSGSHDADIDWAEGTIAFTMESGIWTMNADGGGQVQVTDPPKAGEWGRANLPFGNYDPRFS